MCFVSLENVDLFFSYEVRLKFCDDTDDDANGITIVRLLSSKNKGAKIGSDRLPACRLGLWGKY